MIVTDAPNREQEFEEKAGAFEYHTSKMVDSAEQTAIHGKHATKQLVDNIHTATKEVRTMKYGTGCPRKKCNTN